MSGLKTVAFVTLGSLGDLHPCLAIGSALKQRGYRVKIITTPFYRRHVEELGLTFLPMRPDWDPTASALIGQCEEMKSGPEILFRKLILPHLQATYSDLLHSMEGADLMIAGELVYAAPIVAEKLGITWASLILSPCSFFSAHDPSFLVNAPWMMAARKFGVLPYRLLLEIARIGTRHWWNPVRELRLREGLSSQCDPLMKDKFSPHLVLALFSSWIASPQPDWPNDTVHAGFVFHDGSHRSRPFDTQLQSFLESGDAPMIFTLGSTAVSRPGTFYQTSIDAIRRLSARAILVGATPEMQWINPNILSLPYVPYSQTFPSASVIIHQGGSGTTAQALRAGRPMLFVPWGWDQPDNGLRVARRGAALCISKNRYSVENAIPALEALRSNNRFSQRASEAAAHLRGESGLETAVSCIERLLH